MRITVLGAGNSGFSTAGHLSMLGHEVRLFKNGRFTEDDEKLCQKPVIYLEGSISGKGDITFITDDMKQAVSGSDLIVTAFPAFCRDIFFTRLIPCLEEGQTILLMPDNYGSPVLEKMIADAGLSGKVNIAGVNTCIYACRKTGYNSAVIKGLKNNVLAYSSHGKSMSICQMLNSIINVFKPCETLEQVALSNINCIIHVPAALMNAGWIEHTKGNFDFYADGITDSVSKVIAAADRERVAVGFKLGVELKDIMESVYTNYGIKCWNVHDALSNSCIHSGALSPSTMDNRYITEDVPYGLKPISLYGRQTGVPTPIIDSLIYLSGVIMD